MPKILILGTGGTIASVPTEHGLSASLSGEELLDYCDISPDVFDITVKNLFSVDSTLIQPEDCKAIAEAVAENIGNYDGIVITHGTDTLSYTSTMLSYMLGPINKPVVITGSMLPMPAEGTDAIMNMKDSITAAASDIEGVYAVINRKLILGSRVSKLRAAQFDAFESVNYPLVGKITDEGINLSFTPEKRGSSIKLDTSFDTSIAVLRVFPGFDPSLVDTVFDAGYRGIVLEAYGSGGIPYRGRNLVERISKIASKIPVLLTSQVFYDWYYPGTYEVHQRALDAGVIPIYDMAKEASITKLMWVLGHSRDLKIVKEMMHTNYANEIDTTKLGTNKIIHNNH